MRPVDEFPKVNSAPVPVSSRAIMAPEFITDPGTFCTGGNYTIGANRPIVRINEFCSVSIQKASAIIQFGDSESGHDSVECGENVRQFNVMLRTQDQANCQLSACVQPLRRSLRHARRITSI